MNRRLRIVIGESSAGIENMFSSDGEFASASRTMGRLVRSGGLDSTSIVDFYAYEFVERARRSVVDGVLRIAAPFWPGALVGGSPGAWEDLAALLPDHEISQADSVSDWLTAEAERVGLPRFDLATYRERLAACARSSSWSVRRRTPPHVVGTPTRSTAAAFVLCDRKLLLERRPDDARVTPGVWDVPGGHIESGETPEFACQREMWEELGIAEASIVPAFRIDALEPPHGVHYRHHYFTIRLAAPCEGREGQELGWYAPHDALCRADLAPVTAFVLQTLYESGSFDWP